VGLTVRSKSQQQERDLAKRITGLSVPASGAFWARKGDVRSDDLLVEAKTTDAASFSIKRTIWEKIRREAILDGRIPVLAISIQDRNLVVLDEEDFLELRSNAARHLGEGSVS
jgi:hypothetical protein